MLTLLSGSFFDTQRLGRWGALVGMASILAACQAGPPEESVESAVTTANGLTSNGLTSNGLTSNGLTSNGLTSNGLTSNGLTTSTLTALRDKTAAGDATRMFFRYMVSCALAANKSVTYTWTDSAGALHTEVAPGAFGLAPSWQTGPINQGDQEWVSACLFARTNSLGVSVPISIRGDGPAALDASPQERMDYPYGEGAFWGNLFASVPYGHSCSRSAMRVGAPTSADLKNGRTCASLGCGIINYVGPCFTSALAISGQACFRHAPNNDWVDNCTTTMSASQPATTHVISTWLRP
jgi:hypothetical protein